MAWTWSAPHRGRISGAAAVLSSHRFLNSAIQRAAMTLGRGDAQRGLCIGFAAFLTHHGTVAPNISSAINGSAALLRSWRNASAVRELGHSPDHNSDSDARFA